MAIAQIPNRRDETSQQQGTIASVQAAKFKENIHIAEAK